MATTILPPPPQNTDGALYRWLYLAFQAIINLVNAEVPGVFGAPGVTTVNEAVVPTSGRTLDYLNLQELSLNGVSVTSTSTEINQLHTSDIKRNTLFSLQALSGGIFSCSYGVGAEVSNVINVSIQAYDANGDLTPNTVSFLAYLSDDSGGLGFTASAPSGGVAIGTNGFIDQITSGKVFQIITNSTGMADINITEAGTPTWYLCVVLPFGNINVSSAITFV